MLCAFIGDRNLLCRNDNWRRLVENCIDKGCFVDGDAFPPPQSMSPSPMVREVRILREIQVHTFMAPKQVPCSIAI